MIDYTAINVETVEYKNISFSVWEIGGGSHIKALWRHYYQAINALMFVIDSNDKSRLIGDDNDDNSISYLGGSTAYEQLQWLCNEDGLKGVPVLILANKQDLSTALTVDEITDKLKLNTIRDRQWHVQACSATKGDGLYEGLDWLSACIE